MVVPGQLYQATIAADPQTIAQFACVGTVHLKKLYIRQLQSYPEPDVLRAKGSPARKYIQFVL